MIRTFNFRKSNFLRHIHFRELWALIGLSSGTFSSEILFFLYAVVIGSLFKYYIIISCNTYVIIIIIKKNVI